jgi:hypothetical protein
VDDDAIDCGEMIELRVGEIGASMEMHGLSLLLSLLLLLPGKQAVAAGEVTRLSLWWTVEGTVVTGVELGLYILPKLCCDPSPVRQLFLLFSSSSSLSLLSELLSVSAASSDFLCMPTNEHRAKLEIRSKTPIVKLQAM